MASKLIQNSFVSKDIFDIFPHYSVVLLEVAGIKSGIKSKISEKLLKSAESQIKNLLEKSSIEEIFEIKLWRNALESFGVKQRIARSSLETLIRLTSKGLPRINTLTDIYNSISLKYLIPIGGEDLDSYVGAPKLIKASGNEKFDTVLNGIKEYICPEKGEIIWADDFGATCRRWNWRQCLRTRLTDNTTNAIFIFDNLIEDSNKNLLNSIDDFKNCLNDVYTQLEFNQKLIQNSQF